MALVRAEEDASGQKTLVALFFFHLYLYHALIQMFVFTLGIDVRPEASSGIWRSDIDLKSSQAGFTPP
jgi:hypothetical protein